MRQHLFERHRGVDGKYHIPAQGHGRDVGLSPKTVAKAVLGGGVKLTFYPKGTMRAAKAAEAERVRLEAEKAARIASGERTPVDLAEELDEVVPEPEPEPARALDPEPEGVVLQPPRRGRKTRRKSR